MKDTTRKWVAVCTDHDGTRSRVLRRFVLPEREKWNSVDGPNGPNSACEFEDTVDDATQYALCHVVGAFDGETLIFESVFRMEDIGKEAWLKLKPLELSKGLLS